MRRKILKHYRGSYITFAVGVTFIFAEGAIAAPSEILGMGESVITEDNQMVEVENEDVHNYWELSPLSQNNMLEMFEENSKDPLQYVPDVLQSDAKSENEEGIEGTEETITYEALEELESESETETSDGYEPGMEESSAAPIISSAYSWCSTGTDASQTSCIALTDEQINTILQSVGNVSDVRKSILLGALQKVGRVPYLWGGGHSGYKDEPLAMDCSGFASYIMYHYAGIDLGGQSCAGIADYFRRGAACGQVCSVDELVAGDLIVRLTPNGNHVVVYVGLNAQGLPMVIDEFGHDCVGNVMYQQKGGYYFNDGLSVFIHLTV